MILTLEIKYVDVIELHKKFVCSQGGRQPRGYPLFLVVTCKQIVTLPGLVTAINHLVFKLATLNSSDIYTLI